MTEWQAIETAKRNGTEVLVYCQLNGEQFVAFNDDEDVAWTYAIDSRGEKLKCLPSHWKPLDEVPK